MARIRSRDFRSHILLPTPAPFLSEGSRSLPHGPGSVVAEIAWTRAIPRGAILGHLTARREPEVSQFRRRATF